MPSNLINSSGKSSLITSNNNDFKHVIMPDINTMIISNIITPFIQTETEVNILQNGVSNIYNIFIPNFINRSNNIVIDISGTVNISGDLKISDNIVLNGHLDGVLGITTGYIYPIGDNSLTIGGSNNDIYIGGDKNTQAQNIYIGQSSVYPDEDYKSTIYIGSDKDSVILRGKATFAQVIDQVVSSSTIILNKTGSGNYATSGGSGIDIFDNSYSNIIDSRIYGYIHVGRDLQSFVFKAPSYGSYDINGIPSPKTENDISLLSLENRVRLGVNELKLSENQYVPASGNVRSGLLVLQTNEDFINYQGSHSYYNDMNDPDADYAINISNAFDIIEKLN